jgi:hypothetical protein
MTMTDGLPVYGPAVAPMPGGKWSLLFPVRKSTYEKMGEEALKTAATVCLHDMMPPFFEVDDSVEMEFTFAENYTSPPAMSLVRVVAKMKEIPDA